MALVTTAGREVAVETAGFNPRRGTPWLPAALDGPSYATTGSTLGCRDQRAAGPSFDEVTRGSVVSAAGFLTGAPWVFC